MGQLNQLLLFMGLAALVCGRQVHENCNPDPDCSGASAGDFVPDPTNCKAFYICLDADMPSDISVPCLDGQIFDVTTASCITGTTCTPICGGGSTPAGGSTPTGGTTSAGGTTPAGGTTTSAGTSSPCLDSLDCSTANGVEFIARCTTCDSSYFHCKSSSGSASIGYCSGELVFNPDPLYPYCIRPENCPFHPGGTTPAGGSTPAEKTTPAIVTTPASGTTLASGTTPTASVGTTSAAGTTSACVDSLDCSTANGIEFIARCTTCDSSYFQCKSSSGSASVGYCSGDLVFNPDPIYPYCIRPENCPFHPGK